MSAHVEIKLIQFLPFYERPIQSLMKGQFFIITDFILCIIILLYASIHKSCFELESCEILGQNTHVALCLSVCRDRLSHCIKPLYRFRTRCLFFPSLSFAVKCQMEIQFFCLLPNRWRQHQDHVIYKVTVA